MYTVFRHFDEIAKRRGIFKVESTGECYVATAGLPETRRDHAVAIARYARDIMSRMHVVAKKLEVELGPDTGELSLRIGIHSGPITAGVLRGERARFQLFGQTVTAASRILATGAPGKIQVSKKYAELLQQAGKEGWLQRQGGSQGALESFWLIMGCGGNMTASSQGAESVLDLLPAGASDMKKERLVDWCSESLQKLMRQIVARRQATGKQYAKKPVYKAFGANFLDEVKEIITLPEFEGTLENKQLDPESVVLPDEVVDELRAYVRGIAGMYRYVGMILRRTSIKFGFQCCSPSFLWTQYL